MPASTRLVMFRKSADCSTPFFTSRTRPSRSTTITRPRSPGGEMAKMGWSKLPGGSNG